MRWPRSRARADGSVGDVGPEGPTAAGGGWFRDGKSAAPPGIVRWRGRARPTCIWRVIAGPSDQPTARRAGSWWAGMSKERGLTDGLVVGPREARQRPSGLRRNTPTNVLPQSFHANNAPSTERGSAGGRGPTGAALGRRSWGIGVGHRRPVRSTAARRAGSTIGGGMGLRGQDGVRYLNTVEIYYVDG